MSGGPVVADDGAQAVHPEAPSAPEWGNRVSWRQPRNACLWVFVALLGLGAYEMVSLNLTGVQTYPAVAGVNAAIFLLYAVPFWWFTTHIDRYSRLPLDLKIAGFAYGGVVATWAFSIHANTAILTIDQNLFGSDWLQSWGPGLAAPFTEEWSKGSGVLLLMFIAPRVIRTPFDGFIIGAFVGVGFEVIEDMLYSVQAVDRGFGVDPLGASLHTTALRLATGFTSHIAYSAIFGAGLVYVVGTLGQRRRLGLGLPLCFTAMLLHGIWDAASGLAFGHVNAIFPALGGAIVLAVVSLLVAFHIVVQPERDAMRAVLTPEVETGVLSQEEADALAGNLRTRRHYRRQGHGREDRKLRKHRLQAGHDLADALGHSEGGESQRVRFARAELTRIDSGSVRRESGARP